MELLKILGSALTSVVLGISALFGIHQAPSPLPTTLATDTSLGASLPGATAVFETSLASPITSSATTMTLTANAVRGGGSISGYNCFTVDEGSSQAETICGTVSGTSVTGLTRGISQSTGTTTVSSLQFSHRRGANVKISDFPVIQIVKAQNNGEETFPNILNYTTHPTFVATTNIVDKKYVDDTAFSGAGVIDATSLARGVVELATGAEISASTASGSSGVLAIPSSLATSTYNSLTAPNRVVVTGATGKIDNNFISTSTGLFTNATFATSTNIGAFPAWQIGKQAQYITSTGTSTFSVPSGITKVSVEVIGGGGTGGGSGGAGLWGGGGGGGRCLKNVDVTGTTTIQVYVSPSVSQGAWSTFGTNGFYCYANPGATNGATIDGAPGGTAVGGDLNIPGQTGGNSATGDRSGVGANSVYGGGGTGASPGSPGNAGSGYGSGGSGGAGAGQPGGFGTQGLVIVRW